MGRKQQVELEKDKLRLDWLEKTHFDLIYTTTLNKPRWCVGAEESYFEEEGLTPRTAIDAAMKVAK